TILHLLQVVWAGAYRKPREVNWWSGLGMAGLVLAFALTGYLLPWDQKGYWATQVATGIMGSVPGGGPMQQLVQGGTEYGNLTITRFFAIHVFVLPMALAGLLGLHLWVFRKHGVTPPAEMSPEELERKTQPFWPNQLFLDVLAMAVCGAALVGMTVYTHGAELYAPADPASNFVARPEWYFLFLFQLLKYFEGPLQIIATVLLPGAVVTGLLALPFLDRSPDRKPKGRMKVLAFVGILMAGVVALTALAIVEDANKESYREGLELAEKEAKHARQLALEGILPEGGMAVFNNDPKQKTRLLFKEHCATCHTIEGRGGQEAPSFEAYGTREWLTALVRNPADKRFFGGTKGHDTMEATPADSLSDENLAAVVEYVLSLQGTAEVDDALVATGKTLWDDDAGCNNCHEVKPGEEGVGPNLAQRGTAAWAARVIADSSAPDLFGDTAEMPKFADKLSPEQITALAEFVTQAK
ncbi:MAG: cytochrome b N-terminal domain-containing protein, partial [Nannocystaceae bacterium]